MINAKEIKMIDAYTSALFVLIEAKANVSEFIELYSSTFDKDPSYALLTEYHNKVNDNPDDTIDSYSYEESYSYE